MSTIHETTLEVPTHTGGGIPAKAEFPMGAQVVVDDETSDFHSLHGTVVHVDGDDRLIAFVAAYVDVVELIWVDTFNLVRDEPCAVLLIGTGIDGVTEAWCHTHDSTDERGGCLPGRFVRGEV